MDKVEVIAGGGTLPTHCYRRCKDILQEQVVFISLGLRR